LHDFWLLRSDGEEKIHKDDPCNFAGFPDPWIGTDDDSDYIYRSGQALEFQNNFADAGDGHYRTVC
jgi:hypothetical protein